MKHRSDLVIRMLILELLRREPRGPTRIAQGVNMSYDKCVPHLQWLEQRGFIERGAIEGGEGRKITQRGNEFFLDYQRLYEKWNL